MKSGIQWLKTAWISVLILIVSPVSVSFGEGVPDKKERKYYEYKGNYRENIETLKVAFKDAYGYDLLDLNTGWRPDEIKKIHRAFSKLPKQFHRIPGMKGLYRLSAFQSNNGNLKGGDIPAAAFPKFLTVYRKAHNAYRAEISDDTLRLELYNSLFYESDQDFENIVHHEMGHIYDLSHGFLSITSEWLDLTHFRILNLPALDATPESDNLYTFANDPQKASYAPVSHRHLPTYSRENPHEDFANSVSAYLHYPYFRYSHPARYQFLKKHVFMNVDAEGPARNGTLAEIMVQDFNKMISEKNFEGAMRVIQEAGRTQDLELDSALMDPVSKAIHGQTDPEALKHLVSATCFLNDPRALALRIELGIQEKIRPKDVMGNERCVRMSRRVFEEDNVKWPMMNVYFYREGDNEFIQFLDPVGLNAAARGVETTYRWRLVVPGSKALRLPYGDMKAPKNTTGSVRINLRDTALGAYNFPKDKKIQVEVMAERNDPATFKQFKSSKSIIQFVDHPWFKYGEPGSVKIEPKYPVGLLFLEKGK